MQPDRTVERVEQGVVFVPSDRKRDLLARLLRDPVFARVLVFTRTKHGADRVVRHLAGAGIKLRPNWVWPRSTPATECAEVAKNSST